MATEEELELMKQAIQLLVSIGFKEDSNCIGGLQFDNNKEASDAANQVLDILNENGFQVMLWIDEDCLSIATISKCDPGTGNMEVWEFQF